MPEDKPLDEQIAEIVSTVAGLVRRRSDIPQPIRHRVRQEIGESAIEVLVDHLGDGDEFVRRAAVKLLGLFEGEALEELIQALDDKDPDVRLESVFLLHDIGKPALQALSWVIVKDDSRRVREAAVQALRDIGDPAATQLAIALEDPIEAVVQEVLSACAGVGYLTAETMLEAILNELVVRGSGRSDEFFDPYRVARGIEALTKRNTRTRPLAMSRLTDVAFSREGGVRHRAVAVAKVLDESRFGMLVRNGANEDPNAAEDIMRLLGGTEATAYFSSERARAFERYREPVEDLEEVSRRRWEGLTKQTRLAFYVNIGLSIGLFLVGTTMVIWGLVLVGRSSTLAQTITGGILAGLSGLATTFSTRFWRDPVEHIQRFSAQQARLQVAFIGYMNRVAQVRLVFEQQYSDGQLEFDDVKEYQRLLSEAIDQASQQLEGQIQAAGPGGDDDH
jgi:hypothetical protein